MDDSPYRAPDTQDGTTDYSKAIAQDVRGIQIVTAGLMMGACFIMVIMLFNNRGALGTEPDIASRIGIAFAATMFLLHVIVPGVMRGQQLAQINPQKIRDADALERFGLLVGVFRSTHIVACAMLEGAAVFNLVMYMVTKYAGNLAAAVLLILCIAARFPTQNRITTWIRNTADEIAMR